MVYELRSKLIPKELRLGKLVEQKNKAFYQAHLIEEKLKGQYDKEKREFLLKKLARARKKMYNTFNTISKIPLRPTNLAISEVVGVPKGTVDSSIFTLRKLLRNAYFNKYKRYA